MEEREDEEERKEIGGAEQLMRELLEEGLDICSKERAAKKKRGGGGANTYIKGRGIVQAHGLDGNLFLGMLLKALDGGKRRKR